MVAREVNSVAADTPDIVAGQHSVAAVAQTVSHDTPELAVDTKKVGRQVKTGNSFHLNRVSE